MSQRDRLDRRRDRLFIGFGRLGVRFPTAVGVVLAALFLAGAVLALRLTVTTSRLSFVSEDNWYQSRLVNFYADFGHHDAPIAIISGGTEAERRATVDGFAAALETDEMFAGRVLARVEAEDIASTLMVHAPGQLAGFRRQLPPGADLPAALERGLEGIFGLLETQMLAVLDGELELDASGGDEQLDKLARLAAALDAKLAADAGVGAPVDGQALADALAGDEADALFDPEELGSRGLDDEGYLVSNDQERLLVVAFPEFAGDRVEDFTPAVERLRALAVEFEGGGVEILLTGLPFLAVDEGEALATGMPRSSIAAGLGIFGLLLLAFRLSLRRALVAVLPIAVGTVVSLGALYLLFGELDLITSSFAAVLMGLGIDFSVHLLVRYDEDLRLGRTRREALFSALSKAGPGVVTGALTTALAFLTIVTTEFTSYGNMGVITAIGIVVSLLAVLLLLPMVLGRGDLDAHEQPPRAFSVGPLASVSRRHPLLVVLSGLILALLGLAVVQDYNPRFLEFLPASSEATQGLNSLERDGAMSPWFAWVTADDLDEARRDAQALRGMDEVARVESPSDVLPELTDEVLAGLRADFAGLERDPDWAMLAGRDRDPKALAARVLAVVDALDEVSFAAEQGGRDVTKIEATSQAFSALRERIEQTPEAAVRASLAEIETNMAALMGPAWAGARAVAERGHWVAADLPPMFQRRFVAKDGQRLALYVYPQSDVASGADGNAPARRFAERLESVDPNAGGQGMSLYHHNRMILAGFKRAAVFSLSLVLVLLLLDFGSIKQTVLTLFPVLLGMSWMVGLMALIDLRLTVATIVVIPLTLGIGIDAGVHMMHRCELNARTHRGRARIAEVVEGTGGAVVLSSLTTMVGFAGLLFGRHLGMVYLGMSMVIGIGCTLVASVVVLPALLVLLGEAE